jgi:hypothetical protein
MMSCLKGTLKVMIIRRYQKGYRKATFKDWRHISDIPKNLVNKISKNLWL